MWKITPAVLKLPGNRSLSDFPLCNVDFYVAFEFQSALYASMASVYLNQVASKMIESFEKRAVQIHGNPTLVNEALAKFNVSKDEIQN